VIPRYPVYLFDIDGTLLDSAPDICGAQSEVLEAAGCAPVPFAVLRAYVGLELRAVFGNMLPRASEAEIKQLMQDYTLKYRARKHSGTRVYPGARETLAGLAGRKSTATTKTTEGTRLVLEHFGLLPFFDHVQGSDGMRYKPAPDVVLAAIQGLGAKPEECLMVGDSPADMEAGRSAGVKICAVRYGYGDPGELAKCEPDHWVSDLRELAG
jgi:HAD superfamily hydrolase (TIGR01509 family)